MVRRCSKASQTHRRLTDAASERNLRKTLFQPLCAVITRFVNTYRLATLSATAIGLLLTACRPQEAPKTQTTVFRLFDLFQPDDLTGKLNPDDVGWKRVEWRASEMTPWTPPAKGEDRTNDSRNVQTSPIAFRAVSDLDEPKVSQGQLTANVTGPAPLLDFSLKDNRGGADSVKFIEVRMKVSGAKQIWLRPERGASVEADALNEWASRNQWNTTNDVAEGKLQTYRFEIRADRGSGGGGPPAGGGNRGPGGAGAVTNRPPRGAAPDMAAGRAGAARGPGGGPGGPPAGGTPAGGGGGPGGGNQASGDLRHFTLTFRDCKSAKVSIESVRLVSEREEKLKEASGQQWAGLSEIYRATLAAKTPETIRIPLRELPKQAFLELAIGTKEDAPVKFKVNVAQRDGSKESAPATVFERTVTIPNRWQTARVDLSGYSGKSVVVEFALSGGQKGLWGYWGGPVVRSPIAVATAGTAKTGDRASRKPRGVIFLVTDTLRKDHLNIYGYERETLVNLKQFANEGVAFQHAISQATMTKISIPSMVTSLYPLSHTVLSFDHGLPASAKNDCRSFSG